VRRGLGACAGEDFASGHLICRRMRINMILKQIIYPGALISSSLFTHVRRPWRGG
jgi:hypothetical protein